jgi:DNA-directed RNA polymerase I, II, and III subunit RPABC2
MSDDNYSDIDSVSSDNSEISNSFTNKKPMFKVNIKKYNDYDDSEPDDYQSGGENGDDDDDEPEDINKPTFDIDEDDNESKNEQIESDDDGDDGDDGDNDSDDDIQESDIEEDLYQNSDNDEPLEKSTLKKGTKKTQNKKKQIIIDDDDNDDDDDDENYLQKFDNEYIKNYITDFHPECLNNNYDEISKLSVVIRNSDGIIIDPLHKTIPYLTKYEKTRVIGQRAKQIETGSKPFIKVPENIIDGYIIAELELKEKKIPFIIRRPIPGGACEYWSLKDLECISF